MAKAKGSADPGGGRPVAGVGPPLPVRSDPGAPGAGFDAAADGERLALLAVYLWQSPAQRRGSFSTTAEVARDTGLTGRAIRYWIDRGEVLSIRVGRKHLIWRDSLIRFLESRNWP